MLRLATLFLLIPLLLVGCTENPVDSADVMDTLPAAVEPAPADLATPESAVASYLDWLSYSYRVGDPSTVTTETMLDSEWARVDAYLQENQQLGQGIDQTLDRLSFTGTSDTWAGTYVSTQEDWSYRYFDLETMEYIGDLVEASYEVTYTVVYEHDVWRVGDVTYDDRVNDE